MNRDRSRRESVKKKKKERKRGEGRKRKKEKKKRQSSTTNVRAHRAGSSQQAGSSPRSPGFRDESILFSKYSPNFSFTGMCLLYPNPPLTIPRIRVRGKKTESKKFSSFTFHISRLEMKTILFFFSNNDRVEFIGIILARKKNSILLNVKERTKEKTRIIRIH